MTLRLSTKFSIQHKIFDGKEVQQGSIFSLRDTRFFPPDTEWKVLEKKIGAEKLEQIKRDGFGFEELYPYTEFNRDKDDLAIVVTQTCDLVKGKEKVAKSKDGKIVAVEVERFPKIPFINIALLEPYERLVLGTMERYGELNDHLVRVELGEESAGYVVCFDRIYKKDVITEILRTLNNDHKHIFFLAFEDDSGTQLKGVDLSKLFPLRVDHYGEILKNIKFQLNDGFTGALGWRIAELYGRVGLVNYPAEDLIDLEQVFRKNLLEIFKGAKFATPKKFDDLKSANAAGKLDVVKKMLSEDLSK